eukprot:235516_1
MSLESETDWDNSIYLQDYVVLAYSYLTAVMVGGTAFILFWKLCKNVNQMDDKHSSFIDDDKAQIRTQIQTQTHASGDEQSHSHITAIRRITRASIVALVFYLTTSTLLAIALTQWIVIINEHGHIHMRVRISYYVIPYFINLSLLTFIMFQRFNYYLQSRCVHIASFIFPSIIFIVFCGLGIIGRNIALANGNHSLATSLSNTGGFVIVFATIVDIILGVFYLKQITQVMKNRLKVQIKEKNIEMAPPNTDDGSQKDSDESEVMVSVQTVHDTVRCAFLVMVCAVSNLVMPIVALIGNSAVKHPTHHNPVGFIGLLTDMIINAAGIFLLFRFSEYFYFGICGCCHRCILTRYADKVVNGLMKKDDKLSRHQYIALLVEEETCEDKPAAALPVPA